MAKLRGKLPDASDKRIKMLLFGKAGTGKTTAAIQFPKPYLIDTERGAENDEYVAALKAAGGVSFQTTDYDELVSEVMALLSEKHDFRTLIIDPLTTVYNDLVDKSAEEVGTDFGRHKTVPDRKIKRLLMLLLRLDMNVIITSHAKPKWVRSVNSKGKETITEEGQTFDCYGRLDYLFDLVMELQTRGKSRVAAIHKTRIKGFPEQETIPFSYDEIAERYGRETLERKAEAQALASDEQVAELDRLIRACQIPQQTVDKILEKHQSSTFGELPADVIAKAIAHYSDVEQQMKKGAA